MKIILCLLMFLGLSQATFINPICDLMEVIHYENYITCSHNQQNQVEIEFSRKIKKPESIKMDSLEFNGNNFRYYISVDNLNNLSEKTFDHKYHLTINFYLPNTHSFSELSYHLLDKHSRFISDGNNNDMKCIQPKIVFNYIAGFNQNTFNRQSSETGLISNFNFTIITSNRTVNDDMYNYNKTYNEIYTFDLKYDNTTLSIERKIFEKYKYEIYKESWDYQVTDPNFKLSDIATLVLHQQKIIKEVIWQNTKPKPTFSEFIIIILFFGIITFLFIIN